MSSSLVLGKPTQIQNETTSMSPIAYEFYSEHEQEYFEGTTTCMPSMPTVTNSTPIKSTNQKKLKRCTCCPFGFHIDLDFIRYCEELAANGKCVSSKQLDRRNKRRQRKSLEVMLGFEDQWVLDFEKEQRPSKQHKSNFETFYEVNKLCWLVNNLFTIT